jgi:hypothetical protein
VQDLQDTKLDLLDSGELRGLSAKSPSSSLDRTEDMEPAGLAARVAGTPVVEGLGRG